MEGATIPKNKGARERLAMDFINSEFISETQCWLTEFYTRTFDTVHDVEERMGKLDALRRDEYRCRLCGHTHANSREIMVGVHHIIPKGYMGGPGEKIQRPKQIHSTRNLISLCSDCHSKVHADWRTSAVELFGILGDTEMVKVFKKAGYGVSK